MNETKALEDACLWHGEKLIEEVISSLEKRNFTGIYARSRQAALDEILKRIPKGAVVTHGGSRTLFELKIDEVLEKGDYQYLRAGEAWTPGSKKSMLRDFSSDVYLTSVNAITRIGELVALDGIGNRAACLFFGPAKVVVVAGKNKIVPSLEDGIRRIREYVAPIHARRRGLSLPCTKSGKCVDCNHPKRICNKLAVLQHERDKDRITVILVNEDMGI